MPCPLFLPHGECASAPGLSIPRELRRLGCERGYARALCPRAAAIEDDATAFLVKSHHEGMVEIAWSLEKNHHPVAAGTRRIERISSTPTPTPTDPLSLQAQAVAADYIRRAQS